MRNSDKIMEISELLGDSSALIDVAKTYSEHTCCTPLEITLNYAQKCLYKAMENLSEIN